MDKLAFGFSTPRLRLRALHVDDLLPFHTYRSDPAVARYQGWSPMSRDEAAAFLAAQAGAQHLLAGGWRQFALADRVDDRLLGDVGIRLSADCAEAEFGLSITPAQQGRGLGLEAVCALLTALFAHEPIERIVASSDVRNAACMAVLRRAGMQPAQTETAVYKGERCVEQHFVLHRHRMDV